MDRSNSPRGRKNQGRIKINFEASETLNALFSELSDTSLVSSAAEHAANEKGETAEHLNDHTSTTNEANYNTCIGVNSLPKIVITPAANDNRTKKNGAVDSNVKEHFLPSIKPPLLPTSQLRLPTERIRSASLRRTPLSIRSRPTPIGQEKALDGVRFPSSTSNPSTSLNTINEEKVEQQQQPELNASLDQQPPASPTGNSIEEKLRASYETEILVVEDLPMPSSSVACNVSTCFVTSNNTIRPHVCTS